MYSLNLHPPSRPVNENHWRLNICKTPRGLLLSSWWSHFHQQRRLTILVTHDGVHYHHNEGKDGREEDRNESQGVCVCVKCAPLPQRLRLLQSPQWASSWNFFRGWEERREWSLQETLFPLRLVIELVTAGKLSSNSDMSDLCYRETNSLNFLSHGATAWSRCRSFAQQKVLYFWYLQDRRNVLSRNPTWTQQ